MSSNSYIYYLEEIVLTLIDPYRKNYLINGNDRMWFVDDIKRIINKQREERYKEGTAND